MREWPASERCLARESASRARALGSNSRTAAAPGANGLLNNEARMSYTMELSARLPRRNGGCLAGAGLLLLHRFYPCKVTVA